MNHAQRLEALRGRTTGSLLVSKAPNLRYLTGFTGSSGWLLLRADRDSVFITDGRYGEMAEALVTDLPDTDVAVYTSGQWDLFRGLVEGEASVALEADDVSWQFAEQFESETGVVVTAGEGVVEELRRTKDDDEVGALQSAAEAGDVAFGSLRDLIEPGITEEALGWRLIDRMRAEGGQAAGWEPIVAAGAGSSIPHYRAGRKPVGAGLLLLDYGCTVEGYHSDMTRTVWLDGGPPDEEMERVYRAVAEAQKAGLEAVRPGAECGAVDEAVREVLRGFGYEKQFLHSTGHGVGLEIHEPPWIRRGNEDELRPGDAVTVEPGVYLPGIGGVRIEDMVLVTESGSRVLTNSPKEPTAP